MSVLIKGMSIPDHCIRCPFMVSRDNDDCILLTEEENLTLESFEQLKEHCPLIEVPAHHGDLIDREAWKKSLIDEGETIGIDGFSIDGLSADDVCYAIENAPVIISAERSEE